MFDVNSNLKVATLSIDSTNKCLIVDDFFSRPADVVDFAITNSIRFIRQPRGLPGVVMILDSLALVDVLAFAQGPMSDQMNFCPDDVVFWAYLGMVTFRPEELNWMQRMPHTDPGSGNGRVSFAGVVYLFSNVALGGTGFYEVKQQTVINAAREIAAKEPAAALGFLSEHLPTFRDEPKYIAGSCAFADLLQSVPARFNRLIIYPGDLPHSPHIEYPELLSTQLEAGRLTLSFCVSAFPR